MAKLTVITGTNNERMGAAYRAHVKAIHQPGRSVAEIRHGKPMEWNHYPEILPRTTEHRIEARPEASLRRQVGRIVAAAALYPVVVVTHSPTVLQELRARAQAGEIAFEDVELHHVTPRTDKVVPL